MKIIAISDTHGKHEQLEIPDGDVLIHGGDMCAFGTLEELAEFDDWMGTLPHPLKLAIAGNHDAPFERHRELAEATVTNYTYLQDQERTIDGIKFYGSPWTPPFLDWHFMAEPAEIAKKWAAIPHWLDEGAIDVLVTHGPPHGVCDLVRRQHQGCRELRKALTCISPKVHIFGHIHEGYGTYKPGSATFINASVLNEHYQLVNDPVVIEI